MKEPKDVGIAIHDRFFTLDVGIEDEELVMSVLAGLALYVRKGNSIKIRQSYVTFSGSQEIMTKFISKPEQVGEWSRETKQILSVLRKKRLSRSESSAQGSRRTVFRGWGHQERCVDRLPEKD